MREPQAVGLPPWELAGGSRARHRGSRDTGPGNRGNDRNHWGTGFLGPLGEAVDGTGRVLPSATWEGPWLVVYKDHDLTSILPFCVLRLKKEIGK